MERSGVVCEVGVKTTVAAAREVAVRGEREGYARLRTWEVIEELFLQPVLSFSAKCLLEADGHFSRYSRFAASFRGRALSEPPVHRVFRAPDFDT